MQTVGEFELPGQVLLGQQVTGSLGDKATVSVCEVILLSILYYCVFLLRQFEDRAEAVIFRSYLMILQKTAAAGQPSSSRL